MNNEQQKNTNETGFRVGAILKSDQEAVHLVGYGVYDGDHPIDYGVLKGLPNPRITLDGGGVIWGCECWWGPEDHVKQTIGDRQVIQVDMDEIVKRRAEAEAVEAVPEDE